MKPAAPQHKKAHASSASIHKIFSLPEHGNSSLVRIEKEISANLVGFLKKHIVAEETRPLELEKDFLSTTVPEEPSFVSEHASFLLEKVVAQSVHTASPSFIGHMTSALPYFMLPLAKIMIALNQNPVKIETSKVFTPLESQVLGMIHRLIFALDDDFYTRWTHDKFHAFGTFCSGGTIGNLTALWVARQLLLPPQGDFQSVREHGLAAGLMAHGYQRAAILVSKRGHYSLSKACDILGLGRANLIAVDTDAQHKMDCRQLESTIKKLKAQKTAVMAVVGIAGTTETGNVDPLKTMAAICREQGCYFHVDGAWGGPTLFSHKYRHLLLGIELADSVCMDAHKQLYVPMGAGMVLFRNPQALDTISSSASYIIRPGSRDQGKHTLEGGRAGMALLVHAGLHIIGRQGYELLINQGIEKAAHFARLIETSPDFELISPPELNLLTYRFVTTGGKTSLKKSRDLSQIAGLNEVLSDLTIAIQKKQRERGKSFVSRTTLEVQRYGGQNITVFRTVLANPLTTVQILEDILAEQRLIAQEIMEAEGFTPRLKAFLKN